MVACLDANQVLEYVGGLLDAAAAAQVEAHVAVCAECRHLLADAGAAVLAAEDSAAPTRQSSPAEEPRGASERAPQLPVELQRTYVLGPCIGRGGMGQVFQATHRRLPRRFAVKFLHGHSAADREAIERMQREARVASSLTHPNIVEVFDLDFTAEGAPFIVMELLAGESLFERICREGRMKDLHQVLAIFGQVVSALSAAHKKGVVHRDIKPNNIFLCKDGKTRGLVKLVDFGLAKPLAESLPLTAAHAVMGSPQFMSPEQAQGLSAKVSPRSDIFSLGATLYFVLTGELPQSGSSPGAVLADVVRGKLGTPQGWQRVAAPLRGALQRATSADPGDRPRSVEEFWRGFSRAARDAGVPAAGRSATAEDARHAVTDRLGHRQRRRAALIVAASGALVVGATGLAYYLSGGAAEETSAFPIAPLARLDAAGPRSYSPSATPLLAARAQPEGADADARPSAADLQHAPSPPDAWTAVAAPLHRVSSKKGGRHRARRPSRQGTGELAIQSKGASDGRYLWAEIYIDGNRMGQTPLTVEQLSAGVHEVEIRREGFHPEIRRVRVAADRRTQVLVTLRLLSR